MSPKRITSWLRRRLGLTNAPSVISAGAVGRSDRVRLGLEALENRDVPGSLLDMLLLEALNWGATLTDPALSADRETFKISPESPTPPVIDSIPVDVPEFRVDADPRPSGSTIQLPPINTDPASDWDYLLNIPATADSIASAVHPTNNNTNTTEPLPYGGTTVAPIVNKLSTGAGDNTPAESGGSSHVAKDSEAGSSAVARSAGADADRGKVAPGGEASSSLLTTDLYTFSGTFSAYSDVTGGSFTADLTGTINTSGIIFSGTITDAAGMLGLVLVGDSIEGGVYGTADSSSFEGYLDAIDLNSGIGFTSESIFGVINEGTFSCTFTNLMSFGLPFTGFFEGNAAAVPSISLTPQTQYIPINANNDNASQWQGGNTQTGLPLIRDFDLAPMRDLSAWNGQGAPPPGPAINDPDLKKMTVNLTNGDPLGQVQIRVIYADADNNGGGWIRLWADQSKTTGITLMYAGNGVYEGTVPAFATFDFYVEGIRPSTAENDITIQVIYQNNTVGVIDETTLSVVPFAVSMEVRPSNPATVTLFRDADGHVIGLNSGEQFPAAGGANDAVKAGAIFVSDVWNTGAAGNAWFIQNITGVSNNTEPSIVLTTNEPYRHTLQSGSYPILDYVENVGVPAPFYPVVRDNTIPNHVKIVSKDTPAMIYSNFADVISSMDLTFQARLYTVWQFPDNTIYTLAREDWQVVFKASLVNGVLTPDPTAVVSAQPFVRTGQDPAKVVGPYYNNDYTYIPWA